MKEIQAVFYWQWYTMQILWGLNGAFNRNEWDERLRQETIGNYADRFLMALPNEFMGMVNEDGWNIKNQGTMMLLLYGIVAVPQQLLNNIDINNLDESDTYNLRIYKNFNIEICIIDNNRNETKGAAILRHLRNSVSHARFKVDVENNTWTFMDHNGNNETFNATISHENLGKFITDFGTTYSKILGRFINSRDI